MPLENEFAKENIMRIAARNEQLERIIRQALKNAARDINQFKLRNPKNFEGRFTYTRNRGLEKSLNSLMHDLNTKIHTGIQTGITDHWNLANIKNKKLEEIFLKGTGIIAEFGDLNLQALDNFLNRTENGLNLSKRVWRITDGIKDDLETYIGSGIVSGKSAVSRAKDIEQYISGGGVKYQGRLIKAGNRKFEAIRLAANETNLAYRASDYERRQQLPFVTGITVHLSDQHPQDDICNEMYGDYPKGFIFTGWHVSCVCYTTSKLISKEEFKRYLKTGELKPNTQIQSIPTSATKFLQEKGDRIKKLKSRPYWVTDNFSNKLKLKSSVA